MLIRVAFDPLVYQPESPFTSFLSYHNQSVERYGPSACPAMLSAEVHKHSSVTTVPQTMDSLPLNHCCVTVWDLEMQTN